jgi:hypothetical protein
MDLSDVLNTSMLHNGFFRYLSSVDPGSLFQLWTLIKTPYRMELFFNAIWWAGPLSQTEESDGALSFSNSVGIDEINAQSGWSLKTEKIRINNMYTLILLT